MAADASKTAPPQSVGNYDILGKIAEGGMGTVYRGRHRATGEIVAIKMVPPHLMSNKVLLQRFEKEFRAASKLDHPNVIRALDYGEVDGRPFLVMEFVEGESLGQKIEREGKMAEADAVAVIIKAAEGLAAAHAQGMIHRDVKPDNIMLTVDGAVKLADLGLVKDTESELNLTRTGRGLGTPHFMAPEQFRNAKNADVRCDVYSLGATLYMLVTGELPFRSSGPLDAWMKKVNNDLPPARKLNPALSERTDWAIQRAMSADPKLRPASCQEFIEDLTGTGSPTSGREAASRDGGPQELWYLVYKDEEGVTHTVKGSTAGIRRSLKEGLLGDASNIRASRSKTGTFEPLRSIAEFRDLALPLAPSRGSDPASGTRLNSTGPRSGTNLAGPRSGTNLADPLSSAQHPDSDNSAPHIPLDTDEGTGLIEWLKMLLLAAFAMLVGMLIILLLKK
jgi:serine/threonine protein kinase